MIVILFIAVFVTVSALMTQVVKSDLQDARDAGRTVLTLRESLRRK
jgi:hypothetical protein